MVWEGIETLFCVLPLRFGWKENWTHQQNETHTDDCFAIASISLDGWCVAPPPFLPSSRATNLVLLLIVVVAVRTMVEMMENCPL